MRRRLLPLRHIKKAMMNAHTANRRRPERRVFPLLEADLPEEGLEEVGARLEAG
jgi:hypothetical protein